MESGNNMLLQRGALKTIDEARKDGLVPQLDSEKMMQGEGVDLVDGGEGVLDRAVGSSIGHGYDMTEVMVFVAVSVVVNDGFLSGQGEM